MLLPIHDRGSVFDMEQVQQLPDDPAYRPVNVFCSFTKSLLVYPSRQQYYRVNSRMIS
jgi:hypothetical protein